MKKFLVALLVATSTIPASATTFNFSQLIGTQSAHVYASGAATSPFQVSGSFDGDASGNIISNIRNISLTIDGHHIASPIYAGSYEFANGFKSGGATVSFDGTANNFLFADAALPNLVGNTAIYWSVNMIGQDYAADTATVYGTNYLNGVKSTLSVTAAAVPEPAMLGLFGLGALGLGLRRRCKA